MSVYVCVSKKNTSPVISPCHPHDAARLKAYFATCMRVFRTELDRGASSGEVTDCVIVSKLNNQYSSTCWDNTIIHLSIVEDCRQRDISHCCLVFEMPYFGKSPSGLLRKKGCLGVLCCIRMGNVKYKMIPCKIEGIERDKVFNRILFWYEVFSR